MEAHGAKKFGREAAFASLEELQNPLNFRVASIMASISTKLSDSNGAIVISARLRAPTICGHVH